MNSVASIPEAVEFLITHIPAGFRVVISSRVKPEIACGRLRTERKLREIGTEDLRFSVEEMARLFQGISSRDLNNEELDAWYTVTEGWPVAVVLSSKLLEKGHRSPEELYSELLGRGGLIADYLVEEIWSGLDDELRHFLAATSLLDTVEVDICDQALTVNGVPSESVRLLRDFESQCMMLSCIESGRIYRYHPLIRKYFQDKLEQENSDAVIAGLYLSYGRAYEKYGNFDKAIEHYLAAGSPELAGGIIEENGEQFLASGRFRTLARWLNGIPEIWIDSRPWLLFFYARTSAHLGKLENAERLYNKAAAFFSESGDRIGSIRCLTAHAEFYLMRERYEESLAVCKKALPLASVPHEEVAVLIRMAMLNMALGDIDDASTMIQQAEKLCDSTMRDERLHLAIQSMIIDWMAGDFVVCLEETLRLQREAADHSSFEDRFLLLFFQMTNLRETGRCREALKVLDEAGDYLGATDEIQKLIFMFHQGILMISMGQDKAGTELVNGMLEKVGNTENLGPYFSMNMMADYYRRSGLPEKALESSFIELKSHREKGKKYSIALSLACAGASAKRLSLGDKKAGEAELNEAHTIANNSGFRHILTQIYFHRAWHALELGNNAKALVEIRKSLKLAARYQYNHFIIQEGRISTRLLAFAIEHDIEREYLTGILPAVGPFALDDLAPMLKSDSPITRAAAIVALVAAGGVNAAPYVRRARRDQDVTVQSIANSELRRLRSSIDEPEKILTRRENQVMGLITEGFSNAEIAERLYISEPTTKAHVSSIFRKLGLTSRSQVAVLFQREKSTSDGD